MVKRWLILFLALVTLSLVPGVLAVCYDSDGFNYTNKGYTNGTLGMRWDFCSSSVNLVEQICVNISQSNITINCQSYYGTGWMCSDGKCIYNQTTQNGTLSVTTNPLGASLYVDNIYLGLTPRSVSLPAGSHGVVLSKPGYITYGTFVTIVAGQIYYLNVNLTLDQGNQTNQTVDGCSYLPQWAKNNITLLENGGNTVVKKEGDRVYYHQYAVVPTYPYILLVIMIENMSGGYSNDFVDFRDLNGITYRSITSAEGEGIITFGGTVYLLRYYGSATSPPESRYITLDFPQTQGSIKMTFYCSMQPLPSNLKPTPLPSTGSIRPSPPECNWLRKFFGLFGIGDC